MYILLNIMFTLCIPTMNRYEKYLKHNLPKYLQNKLINEIIISDENGNDAKRIKQQFEDNKKIIININRSKQGPFMNKYICCKMATTEWIVVIDSDNFANEEYFHKMKEFIDKNIFNKYTILSPDYASDVFQWKHLSRKNNILNKETYHTIKQLDDEHTLSKINVGCLSHLMNVGNYVINKSIIEDIVLSRHIEIIKNSYSFDVVLFLFLCFEQLNLDFILVPDCHYHHECSADSVYIQYNRICKQYANDTYSKLWSFLSNNKNI